MKWLPFQPYENSRQSFYRLQKVCAQPWYTHNHPDIQTKSIGIVWLLINSIYIWRDVTSREINFKPVQPCPRRFTLSLSSIQHYVLHCSPKKKFLAKLRWYLDLEYIYPPWKARGRSRCYLAGHLAWRFLRWISAIDPGCTNKWISASPQANTAFQIFRQSYLSNIRSDS